MTTKSSQLTMLTEETVADVVHDQWTGWMEYLFSKCEFSDDGTATIPAWAVERWKRQMATPFADLPPEEQATDLREANKVLNALTALGQEARDWQQRAKDAEAVKREWWTRLEALGRELNDCQRRAKGAEAVRKAAMSLERDGTFHLAHQALVCWADVLKKAGEEERLAEILEAWQQLGDFSAWLSIQEERMRDEREG